MPENAIDDSRIRDERDYLHLGATAAQEGVHLENPLDKAGPRCPAPLNKLRGRFARCGRVRCRRGLLFAEGFRRLCAIGKRPIVAHAMAAALRDVGRDGVDPVQRIEEAVGRAGAGIGTCRNLDR